MIIEGDRQCQIIPRMTGSGKLRYSSMSALSALYMHDEAATFAYVEGMLWASGPVCPACGVVGNAYELKGVVGKALRAVVPNTCTRERFQRF
jgi:hypothetical protein